MACPSVPIMSWGDRPVHVSGPETQIPGHECQSQRSGQTRSSEHAQVRRTGVHDGGPSWCCWSWRGSSSANMPALGGPTLYALMAMFVCRILRWDDIQNGVAFDVVGLYAAACAMGVALKFTGGALWLASSFVNVLPGFRHQRRWPGHRREPAHRDHDQLHERRCHRCRPGPHCTAYGLPGQREHMEGGADHLFFLLLCQFPGGGHPPTTPSVSAWERTRKPANDCSMSWISSNTDFPSPSWPGWCSGSGRSWATGS